MPADLIFNPTYQTHMKEISKGNVGFISSLSADELNESNDLEFGRTLMHEACSCNCKPAVELLVTNGADIEARDESGGTPLHDACRQGSYDVVRFMIEEAGADFSVINDDAESPLHEACREGHDEIAMYLISCGADVLAKDCNGDTPLHFACDAGLFDVALTLISSGAVVTETNDDGEQPIHVACTAGHNHLSLSLLKFGANVFSPNNEGESSLEIIKSSSAYKQDETGDMEAFVALLAKTCSSFQNWTRRKNFLIALNGSELIESNSKANRKTNPNFPPPSSRRLRASTIPLTPSTDDLEDYVQNISAEVVDEPCAPTAFVKESLAEKVLRLQYRNIAAFI